MGNSELAVLGPLAFKMGAYAEKRRVPEEAAPFPESKAKRPSSGVPLDGSSLEPCLQFNAKPCLSLVAT